MITCTHCQRQFECSPDFQEKRRSLSPVIGGVAYDLPLPTLCRECRQQRRSAWINEMNLYHSTCGLTGKQVITNYHPSSPYTVYDQHAWYSDDWDPLSYGREFDFSRPFFEQFAELLTEVPKPNLFTAYEYDENCDYTNHAGRNKDCYLIFDSDESRDCYFSYSINSCVNCCDSHRLRKSELCYECIDCVQCYRSAFLQDCENCSDSAFLKSCTGCKNCLMCCNLKNQEYCIENKPVTKEEFARAKELLSRRSNLENARARFATLKVHSPHKAMRGIQNEDVRGDYLVHCKHADWCFDSEEVWDGTNIYQAFMPIKDAVDLHECGAIERAYECANCGEEGQNIFFSCLCMFNVSDIFYSHYCFHSSNLFGCCGLNRKKYCILNKQYTKEEYEELVPKIIHHMKHDGGWPAMNRREATGSWGEYFPVNCAPHAYNETSAHEYYPLTEEEVLAQGWRWQSPDASEYAPATSAAPDTLENTSIDICAETLACTTCNRNYKILAQELSLLKSLGLPVPDTCFQCRDEVRRSMRNPRMLWRRTCASCSKEIETSFSPEREEKVLCEECYLASVY